MAMSTEDRRARLAAHLLHSDWLPVREERLAERLGALRAPPRRVLVLNATKGPQHFPSTVDFLLTLQRVQPAIRVDAATWFADVHELGVEPARKGLSMLPIADVARWGAAELDAYDVVLAIGPSTLLARWRTLPGLRTRLVVLDLGLYHEPIEASGGEFLRADWRIEGLDAQEAPLVGYSCQPARKVATDLDRCLARVDWRWLPYIPIGFRYGTWMRPGEARFDVALLGSSARDYTQLRPDRLRGLRVLFVGTPASAPGGAELASALPMTVVERLSDEEYGRVLARCRTIVLPMMRTTDNVLLTVVDALGGGVPLVASRRPGFERLEQLRAPIRLVDSADELHQRLFELLDDEAERRRTAAAGVAFAREHLDIYAMLERIVREQVL